MMMFCDECGAETEMVVQMAKLDEYYDYCRECFVDLFLFDFDEVPSE